MSLQFPTTPFVEDEDDFPPPPPDALGLPPKTRLGSLEEMEVFKDVDHKRAVRFTRGILSTLSTDPLFCLEFVETASLAKY